MLMNNKGVKLHNGLCCELARYIAVSEKKTVNNKGLGSRLLAATR